MIRSLVVWIACVACGSRSHAPASNAPAPSVATAAVPVDAAKAPDGPVYRYGVLVTTLPGRTGSCHAAVDAAAACKCQLMPPPMYWEGPPHCTGIATHEDPKQDQQRVAALAVPACMCTCDDAYKTAVGAYTKRLDDCSRVP